MMSYTERDTKYTNWWKTPRPWSFFSNQRIDDCINGQLFVSHWSSTSVALRNKYVTWMQVDLGKQRFNLTVDLNRMDLYVGSHLLFFLTQIMYFHHALFGFFCNDSFVCCNSQILIALKLCLSLASTLQPLQLNIITTLLHTFISNLNFPWQFSVTFHKK